MELRVRRLAAGSAGPGQRDRGLASAAPAATGGTGGRRPSKITVAEPGRSFAFAVTYLRLPVATWRYELHTDGRGGTVLAESVEDHRGALLRTVSPFITGSRTGPNAMTPRCARPSIA